MHWIQYQSLEEVFYIYTCHPSFTSEIMEILAFARGIVTNEGIKLFLRHSIHIITYRPS